MARAVISMQRGQNEQFRGILLDNRCSHSFIQPCSRRCEMMSGIQQNTSAKTSSKARNRVPRF